MATSTESIRPSQFGPFSIYSYLVPSSIFMHSFLSNILISFNQFSWLHHTNFDPFYIFLPMEYNQTLCPLWQKSKVGQPSISAFIFETHLISLKIISLMPVRQHTNVPSIFWCSSHLNISKPFKSLDDQFYDLLNSLCIHPTLSPDITHGPARWSISFAPNQLQRWISKCYVSTR